MFIDSKYNPFQPPFEGADTIRLLLSRILPLLLTEAACERAWQCYKHIYP